MVAILYICAILTYDFFVPQDSSPYIGKTISLTGIVTNIKEYRLRFGGTKYSLQLEKGPTQIPKFIVNVRSDILSKVASNANLLYGKRLLCSGVFEDFESATNLGQFDKKNHYKNKNLIGVLKAEDITIKEQTLIEKLGLFLDIHLHKLNKSISRKYKKILGETDAGTLSAMVLGDKTNIDSRIKTLYAENSISHLLSISGLHISLVGAAIYIFLKKLKVGFKISLILAGSILLLYGLFTGLSVSTSRAVIMMCLFFFSLLVGRSYDALSALSISAISLMFINHRVIYQSGFQLSFMAVVGIFCIMPELNYIFIRENFSRTTFSKIKKFIITSIICSISINITTLPIILFNYYEVSIIGIFLNIIVIPLMSLLVITGILGGFMAILSELFGSLLLGTSYFILEFYTFLCEIAENISFGRLILGRPSELQILIYYVFVFTLFFILSKIRRAEELNRLKHVEKKERSKKRRSGVVTAVMLILSIILTFRRDKFSINMLDIGQGDCFVVNDGEGRAYISDCGSTSIKEVGKYRLLPFLKYNACDRIRAIFVSHMDKDHVNGILELLTFKEIEVDKIIVSINYRDEILNCKEFEELKRLAGERRIKMYYFKAGDKITEGKISFLSLYPTGTERIDDPNEASIVMRMQYKDLSILFTGDAGAVSEEKIVSEVDESYLKCDILKVCHHGSKNSSSSEFLKKVDPKLYLISCGSRNHYGHPHRAALERMEKEGGSILRTDNLGAVEIFYEDNELIISKVR